MLVLAVLCIVSISGLSSVRPSVLRQLVSCGEEEDVDRSAMRGKVEGFAEKPGVAIATLSAFDIDHTTPK